MNKILVAFPFLWTSVMLGSFFLRNEVMAVARPDRAPQAVLAATANSTETVISHPSVGDDFFGMVVRSFSDVSCSGDWHQALEETAELAENLVLGRWLARRARDSKLSHYEELYVAAGSSIRKRFGTVLSTFPPGFPPDLGPVDKNKMAPSRAQLDTDLYLEFLYPAQLRALVNKAESELKARLVSALIECNSGQYVLPLALAVFTEAQFQEITNSLFSRWIADVDDSILRLIIIALAHADLSRVSVPPLSSQETTLLETRLKREQELLLNARNVAQERIVPWLYDINLALFLVRGLNVADIEAELVQSGLGNSIDTPPRSVDVSFSSRQLALLLASAKWFSDMGLNRESANILERVLLFERGNRDFQLGLRESTGHYPSWLPLVYAHTRLVTEALERGLINPDNFDNVRGLSRGQFVSNPIEASFWSLLDKASLR